MSALSSTIESLFAKGKGILAADESPESADKRLQKHGEKPGALTRWQFRELFLETPGIEQYVSGVILHEETLFQTADSDISFSKSLRSRGILPGVKVDQGTEPFPEHEGEVITNGLVGLSERLTEYHTKHEAQFTKWRAVLAIEGDHLPSASVLVENATRLASYACEVQRAGMVPLLEPEVLYDGKHSRMRARQVVESVLQVVVRKLEEQCADPSMVIIKTSMVLSGKDSKKKDTSEEVAEDTVGALLATLPKEIGGVVFLSGGQSPEQSIDNLRAIMKVAKEKNAPWPITFSFSRTFQEEALDIWKGQEENVGPAREVYLSRLKEASEALG
jgi:fructose-bisphosphate aldolase, class I